MQKLLIGLLLLTISTVSAQGKFSPGEPVLEHASIPLQNLAWSADSSTLWFEVERTVDEHIVPHQGYAYDVATKKLTPLDESPFTWTLSEDEQKYFQAHDIVFRSPYDNDIVFGSTLSVPCGNECGGQLIMAGEDWRGLEFAPGMGVYHPLDFTNQGGFQVFWSRGRNAAVVAMGLNYGGGLIYYHIRLDGEYTDTMIDFGDVVESQFFALSDDGTRMLYRVYNYEASQYELRQDEIQTIQFENTQVSARATPQVIAKEVVIGANFIADRSDILYVNEAGIQRQEFQYGKSLLLNPNINATWAQWVLFSPDNRFAAVLANGGLYVLPTEIDLT